MQLLSRILYAAHASGTHHKLSLRALDALGGPEAEAWRRLYLSRAERLMLGSKAPDKSFKDFQNHVLHPGASDEDDWGGAPAKTAEWYAALIAALKSKKWSDAAYAAGVMGHYYTDVWMPFHTGSSEEEEILHRAVEWSANKSFERLWEIGASDPSAQGFAAEAGASAEAMTRAAARASHAHYQTLIIDYDYAVGVKAPEEGLGPKAEAALGRMLAQAAAGLAHLMTRAAAEAGMRAPKVDLTAQTVVAGLKIPAKWVLKQIADAGQRAEVAAIFDELQATGRVEKNLPRELRVVRETRARDADAKAREKAPRNMMADRLDKSLKARKASSRSSGGGGAAPRKPRAPRLLALDANVERAPSIGKKTAARLAELGVETVQDLINCDPELIADCLDDDRTPSDSVRDWIDQARLLTQLPGLTQALAVMLVAAERRTLDDVAEDDAEDLVEALEEVAASDEIQRALRAPKAPTLAKAKALIGAAQTARDNAEAA